MEARAGEVGLDFSTVAATASAWYRWLLSHIGWTGAPRAVQRALVFSLVAGGYFLFFRYAHNQRHFYYDSVHYWNVATSFSLDDYKDVLRGYAFPFLCLALRRFAHWSGSNEFVTFWAASALGMAVLGTIIVPAFVRTLLPQLKFGWWSVIAFNAMLFFFFRGYAAYPLTDIPAAALLLVSYWCVLVGWRWSLLGGLALALAISFRPIYLIGGLGFALLLGLRVESALRARQVQAALLCLGLSAVGFGAGLGPQLYVNHHNFQRLSLLPPTDVAYQKSLYVAQIEWGLTIQRANASIGKSYPEPLGSLL